MKQYRIVEKYGRFYPEEFKRVLIFFTMWRRMQQDRYRWTDGQEGLRFNTLEEAKAHISEIQYEEAPAEVVWVSNLDQEAEKALLDN